MPSLRNCSTRSPAFQASRCILKPVQDVALDTRVASTEYQYALSDVNSDELAGYVARMTDALRARRELADVGNNLANQGNELKLTIDREKASRLGVPVQTIDDTLYDAFGQRQISTIFTQMNQYRVVLEAAPEFRTSGGSARQADRARQRQRRADRQQCDDARSGHVEQLGDAGRHRQHRQHRFLGRRRRHDSAVIAGDARSHRTRRSSSAIRISCRRSRSRSISRPAIRCRTLSTPCTRSKRR